MRLFCPLSQQNLRQLMLPVSLSLVGIALLSACTSQPVYQEQINSQYRQHQLVLEKPLSPETKADLVEAVVAADVAFAQQDYVTATSYYLYAAEITHADELIQQAVQSAKLSGDDLGMQQATELWLANSPKNTEAQMSLITAQLKGQNLEPALLQTEQLLKQSQGEEQSYEWLSQMILASQSRASLAYLQQLRSLYPKSPAVALTQAKLLSEWAAQTQKPEQTLMQSLTNVENALRLDPRMDSAIELKTQLLFRLRKDEEAEAFLREQFDLAPKSDKTAALLGHLLYDLKKFQLAISHYKQWLAEFPEDEDARYYLAASYYATREYENSLDQFRLLLDKDFESDTVAFYCGDAAIRVNQLAQAKACFQLVGEGRFFYSARVELARILATEKRGTEAVAILRDAQTHLANEKENDNSEDQMARLILEEVNILQATESPESAKARLSQALSSYPDNLTLLFRQIALDKLETDATALVSRLIEIRGIEKDADKSLKFERAAAALLFNNGYHQQAVDWVDQALTQTPDDQDLLYSKAIYLEPLGKFEEMIKTFKHLLNLSPGNINVMNALGYTLVDLNQELDYAANLIGQAFAAAPNNAAIIDSKGWLAYRRGNPEEALGYLQTSFRLRPSAEVGAHLGEVFWQMGKQEDARAVWLRAQQIDSDNFLLKKTLDRLGVKLTPEASGE